MAVKILDTKKATHEEWLEARKKSIGGSDAGAVMGMNQYSSLITLYADKKGLSSPKEDSEAMRLGRDLEGYVAERYMEKTGKKVRNDNYMYQHCNYPFITANVDRRIVGDNAGLECKVMGNSFSKYDFEQGEIPESYYCQCQHYMMVMGWDYVDLAILALQRGIYVVTVKRNEDFIAQLLDAEINFWTEFIEKDQMPFVDGSDASLETLKELYPKSQEETEVQIPGLDSMIADYKDAAGMEKHYADMKKRIQGEICARLGDTEIGMGDNFACSWKSQTKDTFDTKSFKEQYPELYKKFVSTSSYRVFRTKKVGRR